MTLGPVRVMGTGVVMRQCVEEVCTVIAECVVVFVRLIIM